MVKTPPANAGEVGPSLSWEDPLEKETATHYSILAQGNLTDRGAWLATVHGVAKE